MNRASSSASLTMTYREAWQAMGISRALFFALKAAGHFDYLLVTSLPHRMSRAKVEEFIHGRRLMALRQAS